MSGRFGGFTTSGRPTRESAAKAGEYLIAERIRAAEVDRVIAAQEAASGRKRRRGVAAPPPPAEVDAAAGGGAGAGAAPPPPAPAPESESAASASDSDASAPAPRRKAPPAKRAATAGRVAAIVRAPRAPPPPGVAFRAKDDILELIAAGSVTGRLVLYTSDVAKSLGRIRSVPTRSPEKFIEWLTSCYNALIGWQRISVKKHGVHETATLSIFVGSQGTALADVVRVGASALLGPDADLSRMRVWSATSVIFNGAAQSLDDASGLGTLDSHNLKTYGSAPSVLTFQVMARGQAGGGMEVDGGKGEVEGEVGDARAAVLVDAHPPTAQPPAEAEMGGAAAAASAADAPALLPVLHYSLRLFSSREVTLTGHVEHPEALRLASPSKMGLEGTGCACRWAVQWELSAEDSASARAVAQLRPSEYEAKPLRVPLSAALSFAALQEGGGAAASITASAVPNTSGGDGQFIEGVITLYASERNTPLPAGVSPLPADVPSAALMGSVQATLNDGTDLWLPASFALHHCPDFTSAAAAPGSAIVRMVFLPGFEGVMDKVTASGYRLLRALPYGTGAGAGATEEPAWQLVPGATIDLSTALSKDAQEGPSIAFTLSAEHTLPGIYSVGSFAWRSEFECPLCFDALTTHKCNHCGCKFCHRTAEAPPVSPTLKCDQCDELFCIGCLVATKWHMVDMGRAGEDVAAWNTPPTAGGEEGGAGAGACAEECTGGAVEMSSAVEAASTPLRSGGRWLQQRPPAGGRPIIGRAMTLAEHAAFTSGALADSTKFFCGGCDVAGGRGREGDAPAAASPAAGRGSGKKSRLQLAVEGNRRVGGGRSTAGKNALLGVPVEDSFGFSAAPHTSAGALIYGRNSLMSCGVHRVTVAGMHYLSGDAGGGTSVVECGGYAGGSDDGDVLVYLGHGGADLRTDAKTGEKINARTAKEKTQDQKDERGNRAFYLNVGVASKPVRVSRGSDGEKLKASIAALGGITKEARARMPWVTLAGGGRGAGVGVVAGAGAGAGAGAVDPLLAPALGLRGVIGPFDDGGDPHWLSSYPRVLGTFREKDYWARERRGGVQAFRPVGLDKIYRYDGLYTLASREFKAAPWSTPELPLKAFFFTFNRVPPGGKQLPGAWTESGAAVERASIALFEAIIRERVRSVMPVDAIAAFCGMPIPSAAADRAFIEYAHATGGQSVEQYGVSWGGPLRPAQEYALAKAAGRDSALPLVPEDEALVALMARDVANASVWAELRAAGVARRCNPLHVVPESVAAVEAAFTCAITCCFPDEPVTLPCGHTFDRAALEQAVAMTPATRKPACAQCGTELEGGAGAWQGAALRARINTHLAAVHRALLGSV